MPEIAQAHTPMMRQYLETKARYPDAILFFRLGDFYEMFFEDALTASEALQITLTARSKGDDKVPMCGVPYHAARGYVARLLEKGFKVAICDQVEEPGKSQLVKREVTRVVTPGMVLDDQVLDPREASWLGAVALDDGRAGLALLDASTGQLQCGEVDGDERLVDELRRAGVRELVFSSAADGARAEAIARAVGAPAARRDAAEFERAEDRLRKHLGVPSLDGFGVSGLPLGLAAAAAALAYLADTQRAAPRHVDRISRLSTDDVLLLDEATRTNLELERTLSGGRKKGTLLALLDRTVTAPGGRRLAEWLRYPLTDLARIGARLDAVEELTGAAVAREELALALRPVADLERLLSRLVLGQGNARDLRALAGALLALPALAAVLEARGAARLREAGARLRGLEALAAHLDAAVAEEPPATLREGGIIRRGHSAELDEIVAIAEDGKGWIAALEAKERERTGIGSLKVRFNKVFGYYLEVTRPNLHLVPKDWERRQTTVGGERFVTPELKTLEEKVLTAEERRAALEERLFEALRQAVAAEAPRVRTAADAVATADALLSLSRVAAERGYVRPEVDASEALEIVDGRHPVVEAVLPDGPAAYVPNDVLVASRDAPECAEHGALLVITGPNMAGKSTVMREAALVVLLAQMGAFVPARRARIGLVDRIFTRVGASDDLARGRSTFMVEMTETAAILHNATRRSLVVLDEIGRGTSTFDGVSIAWAVAEHLHDVTGCRTLFATHYHELQDLARERPAVRNLTVAVREVGDRVVFLRKLVQGGASRSYGIEVAKLAGLPAEVLARAREILKNLEAMEVDEGGHPALARGRRRRAGPSAAQLGLFGGGAAADPAAEEVAKAIRAIDLDALRPLDALNLLAGWKKSLE
ncbi:DNA mismatch repair protein MutS [Anaeromyxobacter sp. K]|uniref:DNA mismatch repair protein MutS n=1 Tax=Anaeromyxobacter sp. (strain K) TaxID=447217 RepID=MUTS_ANASK|nr:DNA mismatch repair protein MutS [Anaeromyxobacter sp. K]B4UCY7.1 RecName: Full=DNA mismatch repair protein MutS [Anaeromyxobacter sp. K]ACG73384.1 DNA mismatch repair protein MutS [Anaeromyxobacter sp. K]